MKGILGIFARGAEDFYHSRLMSWGVKCGRSPLMGFDEDLHHPPTTPDIGSAEDAQGAQDAPKKLFGKKGIFAAGRGFFVRTTVSPPINKGSLQFSRWRVRGRNSIPCDEHNKDHSNSPVATS